MTTDYITQINQQHVDEMKELRSEIIALRISIVTLVEADKRYFEKFVTLAEKQSDLVKDLEKNKLKFEKENEATRQRFDQKFEELERWKYKITGILISIAASAGIIQQVLSSFFGG